MAEDKAISLLEHCNRMTVEPIINRPTPKRRNGHGMKISGQDKKRMGPSAALTAEETAFVERVGLELIAKGRIRTVLPGWGRLHIDRALPFLCLYRRPPNQTDAGMDKLLAGEASFLVVSGERKNSRFASALLKAIVESLGAQFGSFLILEIWAEPVGEFYEGEMNAPTAAPEFRIFSRESRLLESTVRAFEASLRTFRFQKKKALVEIVQVPKFPTVNGMTALTVPAVNETITRHLLGLQLRPVFRTPGDVETCEVFPILFRQFRRGLSLGIRKALFRFMESRTSHRPPHFQAMGPRALTKLVWEVDRRLTGICDNFDYLFQVTPVNAHAAWRTFQKKRFQKDPEFSYRPLPYDPSDLKRQLFQIPVERIEDPALAHLFREKQDELDRMISLLRDCNTPRFLHGSIQVFGGVDEKLAQLAKEMLQRIPPRSRNRGSKPIPSQTLADHAQEEIRYYRELNPDFSATVQIREDVPSGFLVSKGELFIGAKTRLPSDRLDALLQHEIGVHLVTWFNGNAQPFRLLCHGLAGYEELQEGLAVLAEYLVGGLTPFRLRILAARVLAIQSLIHGGTFTETFNLLHSRYGFAKQSAFQITMRVYRGGGLTKDAVYLRGLEWLLQYLKDGGDLEPLWIGKIGARHIPIMQELRWRKVIQTGSLTPRFLHELSARKRMEKLQAGATVMDLLE